MKTKFIVILLSILFFGVNVTPIINGNNNKKINIYFSFENEIEKESFQPKQIYSNSFSNSIFFTKNHGQFSSEVLFQTHISETTVYLCHNKIITVFNKPVKSIPADNNIDLPIFSDLITNDYGNPQVQTISIVSEFVAANDQVTVVGDGLLSNYNNYFIGNDPYNWFTNVPNYKSVYYTDIYSGIDLRYYGLGNSLKYDFIVHPGVDPSIISLRYSGFDQLQIIGDGDLNVISNCTVNRHR